MACTMTLLKCLKFYKAKTMNPRKLVSVLHKEFPTANKKLVFALVFLFVCLGPIHIFKKLF